MSKFFPYWPVFLLLLLLTFSVAFFYLKFATPLYACSATIMIQDEKKGAEDPKMVESLNFFSSKKIVENEIEVIHSRSLLAEVVKDLNLMAPVFEKGKYSFTSAYLTSPVQIEVKDLVIKQEEGQANDKIPFSYLPAIRQLKLGNSLYPLDQWVSTPYGTLKFVENKRQIASAKNPLFFSLIDLNREIEKLAQQISVTPVSKLSTVVKLDMEDEVPQRGNDILNSLAKAYNAFSIKSKNEMAENTLLFVENRIRLVEQDLDSLEKKIQKFKAQQGIVDLSVQGRQYIENVGTNDQKIADINMQLAVVDQVEKYVLSKDNKAGIVPATLGVTDPVLANLLQKLYDSESQYEKLKRLTGENNPMLLSLAGDIAKIRPAILENIRNQRQSLEAGKTNVNTTNVAYSRALSAIPQKEKALLDLTRQQGIVSNVYTFLLQKREETALSYSSNIANNKIIDNSAASVRPVSPRKPLVYLIAFVVAIGGGVSLVLGRELFSNKILYRSEIEKLTAFAVIAEIAYEKERTPLVIGKGERSLVAEQFRKLRASLSSIGIVGDKKKILITSTISGEGKSFIAANLGLTLAIAGKKVILLEVDLANPSLSTKLRVRSEKGITEFLEGSTSPEHIIMQTHANSNLFIIPSGELPDNPSELIMNGRMDELFTYLESRYDYIIVDSAPVHALSDAYVLSPLCDATLYVVRHNHTLKAGLQRLDESNQVNELKNVKILFNSVKPRGFSKRYYGYGYDYSYGYNNKVGTKKQGLLNKPLA